MKIVKIIQFKENYDKRYLLDGYLSLEEWQKKNPKSKIIDTKINQVAVTYYENILLVTYEEEEVKE